MNNLTPAQTERFGKLLEESGEVQKELGKLQQTIGKIIVHGLHTDFKGLVFDNQADLEREIGDFLAAVDLLAEKGDLDAENIQLARVNKRDVITKYMKHQYSPRYSLQNILFDSKEGLYWEVVAVPENAEGSYTLQQRGRPAVTKTMTEKELMGRYPSIYKTHEHSSDSRTC